jgi:hypothetical protein
VALLCIISLSMIDCVGGVDTCMVMMSDVDIKPILDRYMLLTDKFVVVLTLNQLHSSCAC